MSVGSIPPFIENMLRAFDRRLKELERRLNVGQVIPPSTGLTTPPCNFPGLVANGVVSPRFYGPSGQMLSYDTCRISANTPAAGTLSVAVKLNGSTVLTVSLVSSAATAVFASAFSKGDGQYLTCETTAVGGQLDVSVELNEVSAS